MSRYLVTGCAGFIGSHLVDGLLARGDDVVGVDAFTDFYARERKEANLAQARAEAGFSLIEADLAETPVEPLLESVEAVFHLAAQPGVRESWGSSFAVYVRDNLLASQRLFEAAAHAHMKVVLASSSSVYGSAERYPTPEDARPLPVSPYGVTKAACEGLAYAHSTALGLEIVVLRYFTVYGPRQRPDMAFARMAAALAEGEPFPIYGSGEQSRDFTYVADAVSATLAALEAASGSVYNVGGGSEASLAEVIAICERLTQRRLEVVHEPNAAGDVKRTAADTSRIRGDLGWEPRVSLEQGLQAQLCDAGVVG